MARPALTYAVMMAAAQDAGNRSMRAAGRRQWSKRDHTEAITAFNLLRGPWQPASGTPGATWRVTRPGTRGEPSVIEACGPSGRRLLFKSLTAAKRRAAEMNADPDPPTPAP